MRTLRRKEKFLLTEIIILFNAGAGILDLGNMCLMRFTDNKINKKNRNIG